MRRFQTFAWVFNGIIAPMRLGRTLNILLFLMLASLLMGGSSLPPGDKTERVRAFTRDIEFDYIAWTLDALQIKLGQVALGTADYLSQPAQRQQVLDYRDLVIEIQNNEAQLAEFYASPNIPDPQAATIPLRKKLDDLRDRRARLGPLAESVLQEQLSRVVAEAGLTMGGQPLPPVMYHSTPLPKALIVSPRDAIRQDNNISIGPDLTIDQLVALEEQVDKALNVSSLVVDIGGIGMYPTMVMQTSDLNWMAEVVAHEWVHNFLTMRPLGLNYESSPELRTMNETVASIAGKEIGRALMLAYYPELAPPPPPEVQPEATTPPPPPAEPPAFDFRSEMRTTRVTVDQLLAEGKIEEAEAYMEQRRLFLWDNGYHIRKINQAYFAFHGAYADQPGGAAGEDPVGAAVRLLRARSGNLAEFVKRISWMTSFEQLRRAVNR
jgi:hypothetical protein